MNDKMQKAQSSVERRITLSAALLKDMGMSPEAYCRVALNALGRSPGLGDVDQASLELAFVSCMECGLLPDGREAAIYPAGGKAVMIPMIEGRIKLARRATPGLRLRVRSVHQGDRWEWAEGLAATIEHQPVTDPTDDTLTHVYAIADLPGAPAAEWEVMSRATVDRYRARSAADQRGRSPWSSDYIEMAKKTVLGQLLKRLPRRPGDPADEPEIVTVEPAAATPPVDARAAASDQVIDATPAAAAEPEKPKRTRRAKAKPAPAAEAKPAPAAEAKPADEPPHPADQGPSDSPFPEGF